MVELIIIKICIKYRLSSHTVHTAFGSTPKWIVGISFLIFTYLFNFNKNSINMKSNNCNNLAKVAFNALSDSLIQFSPAIFVSILT